MTVPEKEGGNRQAAVVVSQALQLIQHGRPDEARAVCRAALADYPRDADLLHILGLAELRCGNPEPALQLVAQAIQRAPQAGYFATQGMAYRAAGRHDDAIGAYRRALQLDPRSAAVYFNLGHVLRLEKRYAEAIEALEACVRLNAQDPDVFAALGNACYASNRLEEAGAHFERALAIKPTHYDALTGLGFVCLRRRDFVRATVLFNKCAKAYPKDPNAPIYLNDTKLFAELARRVDQRSKQASGETIRPAARMTVEAFQPNAGRAGGDMTVCFFHADADNRHPMYKNRSEKESAVDYRSVLDMACRSVRLAMPKARIVLLTDEKTDCAEFADVDFIARCDVPAHQLMYARMQAYHAFAASNAVQGPVMFLDTDICVNRDFSDLFDGSFDVALTWRERDPLMPVNEGMILGRMDDRRVLQKFFGQCLDIYDWLAALPAVTARYGFDVRNWRGGQLSLAVFLNWFVPPFSPETIDVNGIRCRFLDCDEFNFSIQAPDFGELARKWAVHFKGVSSKAVMADFLQYRAGLPT